MHQGLWIVVRMIVVRIIVRFLSAASGHPCGGREA